MMRRLAIACLALSACTSSATEIVVVVTSDYSVPKEMASVRAVITFQGAAPQQHTFKLQAVDVPLSGSEMHLPLSFAIGPNDSGYGGSVEIELFALAPNASTISSRRVNTRFISGKKLLLDVFLPRGCMSISCATDKTCTEMGCVSPEIDPSTLPVVQPGHELDVGVPLYDASIPDATGGMDAIAGQDALGSDAMDAGAGDSSMDAVALDVPDLDSGLPDAAGMDAAAPDATLPDAMSPDATNQGTECLASAIIDLNTAGTRTGSVTHYIGDNGSAPYPSSLPGPVCQPTVGHEQVFTYTPNTSTRLQVSSAYPTTQFDTVLWALDQCSANATELACNDDIGGGVLTSLFTITGTAGRTMHFVLAGYNTNAGPYDLGVRELTAVPPGMRCYPNTTYCTQGSSCSWTGTSSTCVAPPTYQETAIAPIFIDACTAGTHVDFMPNRDDGHPSAAIPLPFTFPLYRVPFTAIWPDTNGYAVLGSVPPVDVYNPTIPETQEGPAIGPFWEDLVVNSSTTGSDVCVLSTGVRVGSRQFVVEWRNVVAFQAKTTTHLTFELILNESGGTIDFVYQTMLPATGTDSEWANGMDAKIAIQSAMGSSDHLHSGLISAPSAIRLTPH
jgi:hypothetical protein